MPNGEAIESRIVRVEEQSKQVRNEITELFDYRNDSSDRIAKLEVGMTNIEKTATEIKQTVDKGITSVQRWVVYSLIGFFLLQVVLKLVFHI